MIRAKSLTPFLCLLYVTIVYTGTQADVLIRRSDLHMWVGRGVLDEKQQTITFTICKEEIGKPYKLKEYEFKKGAKDCEQPPIFVAGSITIESTSIAAGIGVTWGDGKLTFKGKTYPFSVDGLSLVDWGISKASATGDVYNLTDVAKFAGTCVAAEAGLTLAGGVGGMVLRNQDGVIIHIRSTSRGAKLQLGTSGFIIKLK